MVLVKRVFEFYLNSHIHVALAVCSLSMITHLNFELPVDYNFLAFTFFGTISGYNFVKYFGLAKFHHKRLAPWLKHIQMFAFLCFLVLIFFAFRIEFRTLCYFGLAGVFTFFYAIPFLPKQFFIDKTKNLRRISGLKIYVIVFVWTTVSVWIPFINAAREISFDILITVVQIALYVLTATLPFEIRDLQFDSIKLSTIPQRIGVHQTKILGSILLFIMVVLQFFKDDVARSDFAIIIIIASIMLLFLWFSTKNQGRYYSSFWVEALPVLWLILSYAFV